MHLMQSGTGTWNGPAPRGAGAAAAATAAAAARPAVVSEPRTVLMNNGRRIPLMGLGTYKISDPAVISRALELGCRHIDCECPCQQQHAGSMVAEGTWNVWVTVECLRSSMWAATQ
jgi:hypothetical protein